MDSKKAAMLAAVCGAVVLIGVLMPWYSMSVDFGEAAARVGIGGGMSQSLNGTEGDFKGGFVLALGLAGGLAGALLWRGSTGGLPVSARGLAILGAGAFGLGALVTLTDVFRDIPSMSGTGVSAGRGAGMYVTLLACGAGAYLCFLCVRGTPTAGASS